MRGQCHGGTRGVVTLEPRIWTRSCSLPSLAALFSHLHDLQFGAFCYFLTLTSWLRVIISWDRKE